MKPIAYVLDQDHRVKIEWRSENSWALLFYGFCISKDGSMEFEPQPSSRTEEFLRDFRFPTAEAANEVFQKYKHELRVNGRSWREEV